MPIKLNGGTYYRSAEACRIAETSKNTFLRWVKNGTFADVEHRDRGGWRLFTKNDLDRLEAEVNRIHKSSIAKVYVVSESDLIMPGMTAITAEDS